MEENKVKTHKFLSNIVKLTLEGGDLTKEMVAALSLNPTIRWIKFVLTDDSPNGNKQRVPKEEFSNLIKTGIHMPIKMSRKFIRDGHEFSVPIGTITSLAENENLVEGIAALWTKEFPEEIKLLEKMNAEGEQPQLSWELLYTGSDIVDDIESLKDVALSAATIVNMPAYQGRTPIFGMASQEETKLMEEKIRELEEKLRVAGTEKAALETKLSELQASFDTAKAEKVALEAAKAELEQYKIGIETTKAKEDKFNSIVALFEKAEVVLPDEYLTDEAKKEKLLGMGLDQLEFLVQDLALFAAAKKPENASAGKRRVGSNGVPNLTGKGEEELTVKEIAEELRKAAAKKE